MSMVQNALAVAALLAITGCGSRQPVPYVPGFPTMSDIKEVRAQIVGPDVDPMTEEFDVPTEYVGALLRFLQPAEYCPPDGRHHGQMSRIIFVLHNGTRREAQLFFYGKHPVRFTFDGVPLIRGGDHFSLTPDKDFYVPEANVITGLLREIHNADSNAAAKTIDELDRSAGRKQPHF